jgi:hypothetical protein
MADTGSDLKLPWRRVAFACLVVTAASVGALVVVASLKKADTLATVALALAVLAFAAQLVIAIAQGNAASQQLLQSEKVNTQTQSLLSEIRSGSNELTLTVRQQFDFVLRHALGAAIPDAVKEAGLTDLEPTDIRRLRDALGSSLSLPTLSYSSPPSAAGAELADYLETFPTEEEAGTTPEVLRTLTPLEVVSLRRAAEATIERLRTGQEDVKLIAGTPGAQSLMERGYLEKISSAEMGDGYFEARLTEAGRALARLLIPRNPPPWLLARLIPDSAESESENSGRPN